MRFALPLSVSNALQTIYHLVDVVVVGSHIEKASLQHIL